MKLAFATSSFFGGGITSYAHEVINSFSHVYEMSVIVGDDSRFPISNSNVKLYHIEGDDCSVKNARKAVLLINETIHPDVLLISNSKVFALVVPFISDGIKVITVSHSLKYIEADIAAINHRYIDRIIALSEYNKMYLAKRFRAPEKKFDVIFNFVEDYKNHEEIIKKKKLSKAPLRIIYMGGSSGSKSPDIVLKVLKKLSQTSSSFDFYWIGADTPPLKSIQPFDNISSLFPKTDKRLHFTGRIERNEVASLLELADILLIPSRREGCPMALLEALRVGTVAIVSDFNNGCKEIIKDHYNGYVIAHNRISDFVNIITSLANDKSLLEPFYDKAYMTFHNELSFDKWFSSMTTTFKSSNEIIRRNKGFSLLKFYTVRLYLAFLNLHNKTDKLINESLRTAWPFFIEFMNYRNNKDHTARRS